MGIYIYCISFVTIRLVRDISFVTVHSKQAAGGWRAFLSITFHLWQYISFVTSHLWQLIQNRPPWGYGHICLLHCIRDNSFHSCHHISLVTSHSWQLIQDRLLWGYGHIHPPSLSKFTPFCFEGFSSYEDILSLLLGVAYSESKSESSSSSEVRNYDHHRWETNRQMEETNTLCVPFDVFLFYHWERYEKVDHVRHRGLKEWFVNRFSPCPYFAGLFRALQAPCGVAINS